MQSNSVYDFNLAEDSGTHPAFPWLPHTAPTVNQLLMLIFKSLSQLSESRFVTWAHFLLDTSRVTRKYPMALISSLELNLCTVPIGSIRNFKCQGRISVICFAAENFWLKCYSINCSVPHHLNQNLNYETLGLYIGLCSFTRDTWILWWGWNHVWYLNPY